MVEATDGFDSAFGRSGMAIAHNEPTPCCVSLLQFPQSSSWENVHAQPLREFAMFQTIPPASRRKAVCGRNGTSQTGRRVSSFSASTAAPSRGAILAMRQVCFGVDTDLRPTGRNSAHTFASADNKSTGRDGCEVGRGLSADEAKSTDRIIFQT